MAAEIGHLSLWLALAAALCLSVFPLVGVQRNILALQWYARPLAWVQWLALTLSMVCLGYSFFNRLLIITNNQLVAAEGLTIEKHTAFQTHVPIK